MDSRRALMGGRCLGGVLVACLIKPDPGKSAVKLSWCELVAVLGA
jgi:hypothetical protein